MITRPFFSRHTIVLACVLGACATFATRCYAVDLITEDEAKLPPAAKMATRGGSLPAFIKSAKANPLKNATGQWMWAVG